VRPLNPFSPPTVAVGQHLTQAEHEASCASTEARIAKAREMLARKSAPAVVAAHCRMPLHQILRLSMELREEQRATGAELATAAAAKKPSRARRAS
jgi:hypothetical protein